MSAFPLTRRAGLLGLGALALQELPRRRPRHQRCAAFEFAPSKLMSRPFAPASEAPRRRGLEQALPGALAQSLAPYMAPGDRNGATWWRRSTISIWGQAAAARTSAVSTRRRTRSLAPLILRGPRGGVVANVPLRAISSYFPMAVDQTLVERRTLQGRVVALAQAFAGWAPRELGL